MIEHSNQAIFLPKELSEEEVKEARINLAEFFKILNELDLKKSKD